MAEADRLAALRRYEILDTAPEPAFDRIVELAARMFDAPMATISLLDADRLWVKARVGFDVDSVPRKWNLYERAIVQRQVLVMRDLASDPRLAQHPYVTVGGVRFYASAPLHSADGHGLGAVTVVDTKARPDLPEDRVAGLQALARLVEAELDRRLLARQLARSADRYRDLAELSSDWMWESDAEHRITEVSSTLPALAGIALTSIGRRRWEYEHAHPLAGTWDDYKAMLEARREFRGFEYEVMIPDGEHHVFRISGKPRFDEASAFLGYSGTGSDLTEQRLAERRLRDSEASFRFLFEHNPNPMFLFEQAHLRFVAVNEAACALYGYDRAEFEALNLFDVRPEEDGILLSRHLAKVDWTLRAERRWRHLRKDGAIMDVLVNAGPMRFNGMDCQLVQVRDITHQLRNEARLAEAEAHLRQRQKLESLGRLTGGIAHDFNNMLAAVMGNIECTLDDLPPDARSRPWLAEALAACERGADLVSRLLTFARRRSLAPQEVAPGPLLEEIAGLVRDTVTGHASLSLEIAGDLRSCRVDRGGLESAILGLAANARESMPHGGDLGIAARNRRISEAEARDQPALKPGDWIEITISDTGAGMTPEIRSRAFEPFFTTKEEGTASGLGLAMVHGFVHQSGGFLTLSTSPGHGTVFRLYLPSPGEAPGSAGFQPAPARSTGS